MGVATGGALTTTGHGLYWYQTPSPLLEGEHCKYIYNEGWKSIHNKYKACQSKYKHKRENQNNQNSRNEVQDLTLTGHALPQMS